MAVSAKAISGSQNSKSRLWAKAPGPKFKKVQRYGMEEGAKYGPWLSVKRCVVQEGPK